MGTELKRPSSRCEEVMAAAAASLAKNVLKNWNGFNFSPEEATAEEPSIAADILKAMRRSFGMDGFQIAKELDEHGWDVDADLVEILSGAYWEVDREHRQLVAKWVIDNQIAVTFVVGDTVKSPKGEGIVTEIDAALAKVNVHTPDQKDNSAWVFDAEEIAAIATAAA
jgi:hypothetical protein